jgi:hypothetical protein
LPASKAASSTRLTARPLPKRPAAAFEIVMAFLVVLGKERILAARGECRRKALQRTGV